MRRAGLTPCLVHSRIQNVHQTNARVRKCSCECKCSKRTLLDSYVLLSPFVNIRNVAKGLVFIIFFTFCSAPVERNAIFQLQKPNPRLCVNRFRSMHVERNAPSVLIHTRLLYAQNHSRSALVDRIADPYLADMMRVDIRK